MTDKEIEELRELFIKRMSVDSEEIDRRKKGYNQAIFFKYNKELSSEYRPCFPNTTMEMVLDKFDLAVKDMKRLEKDKK